MAKKLTSHWWFWGLVVVGGLYLMGVFKMKAIVANQPATTPNTAA